MKPLSPLAAAGYRLAQNLFAPRTLYLIKFDMLRLRARLRRRGARNVVPPSTRLHLGCGVRKVTGWLNVDVHGSDYDIDLACGRLPWADNVFDTVVSQHVIEHLELLEEFIPLLYELYRVVRPGGVIWLSCPDMERICRAYAGGRIDDLMAHRRETWPSFVLGATPPFGLTERGRPYPAHLLGQVPPSHLVNDHFHQWGQHKNLYDFELLRWALAEAGFAEVESADEAAFLARFPTFVPQRDDPHAIYVTACKRSVAG